MTNKLITVNENIHLVLEHIRHFRLKNGVFTTPTADDRGTITVKAEMLRIHYDDESFCYAFTKTHDHYSKYQLSRHVLNIPWQVTVQLNPEVIKALKAADCLACTLTDNFLYCTYEEGCQFTVDLHTGYAVFDTDIVDIDTLGDKLGLVLVALNKHLYVLAETADEVDATIPAENVRRLANSGNIELIIHTLYQLDPSALRTLNEELAFA